MPRRVADCRPAEGGEAPSRSERRQPGLVRWRMAEGSPIESAVAGGAALTAHRPRRLATLLPITVWLRRYRWDRDLLRDGAAGLALAQQTGRLTLSLVGTNDTATVGALEIDRNSLLGIQQEVAAPEAPKEKVCTIRTNKGGEVVETVIPCTN